MEKDRGRARLAAVKNFVQWPQGGGEKALITSRVIIMWGAILLNQPLSLPRAIFARGIVVRGVKVCTSRVCLFRAAREEYRIALNSGRGVVGIGQYV